MRKHHSIFLIGPMGAGKSTVGRRLAEELRLAFVDSDKEIEARSGAEIPLIFELEGEAGFRRREREAIDALTQRRGIVLATGGGAVLAPANRCCLAGRGLVVYLHTTVDEQLARTAGDRNRPLLQTADPRGRLEALMAERDPLYREIADLILDTDGAKVAGMTRRIIEALEGLGVV